MDSPVCHAAAAISPKDRARELILKSLGVKRVADWTGVAEDTVYQWIRRGTDAEPVPASRVPVIIAGAKAAGLDAPLAVLWPAMAAQSAEPVP